MVKVTMQALKISRQSGLSGGVFELVTLSNKDIDIQLSNLGCTLMSILVPDRNGQKKNVVAGFTTQEEYFNNEYYFGCVVGRVANRIAGGRFDLNGETIRLSINNNGNHLHGGLKGFHCKVWEVTRLFDEPAHAGVEFEYTSADGEEGYPGNLRARVKYLLDRQNRLTIHFSATTDKTTPVNLTNHTYFNLSGFDEPTILGHKLKLHSQAYIEKGATNVPTGRILPLNNTALDFSKFKPIGQHISELKIDHGYDHCYVLDKNKNSPSLAAELSDPVSGRLLNVYTDLPGIQLYSANEWDGHITGSQQIPYIKHGALALETQFFPDSVNHAEFPSILLEAGQQYHSTTIFEFGTTPVYEK
ncbi:MAG TPA: aldose epimerase family protein [Flavitalea sp.]|nr:aldose epimerase family protein [Flavitalea sp.]